MKKQINSLSSHTLIRSIENLFLEILKQVSIMHNLTAKMFNKRKVSAFLQSIVKLFYHRHRTAQYYSPMSSLRRCLH